LGTAGSPAENPAVDQRALKLPPRSHGGGRVRDAAMAKSASVPLLAPDQSVVLRDRLLNEIANLPSPESATEWAKGAMAAKNRLTAEDAKFVADAFEHRLSAWSAAHARSNPQPGGATTNLEVNASSAPESSKPSGIDKGPLAIPAPRRYRDREHL